MKKLLADTTPLQSLPFKRLWQANIITVIGAQLTVVAVPAQIYSYTGNSGYVGLAGLFGLVPLVVFGLYGGSLADAMDRRKLLIFTTSGLIACAVLFWLQTLLSVNNVWLLLCIFALQQAFFAINQPTRTAITAKIVPEGSIAAAMSLNMTVTQFGAIVGPLVGGMLIPVVGYSWLYLADAVFLLATLRAVIALPPLAIEGEVQRAGFSSVMSGFAYLGKHPVLLMSFVVDLIAMIFGMPRALFPQISHIDFGGPVDGGFYFAFLYAGIPFGALVGGIFSGWISRVRRYGVAIIVSIVIWGASIAVMGAFVTAAHGRSGLFAWGAIIGLAIGGAADMASAAFRSTMLQEAADDAVRGRLQGVFIVVVAGGPRIADLLHGWLGKQWGAGPTVMAGGIAVIVGVLIASALVPSFVRFVTPSKKPLDSQ